VKQGQFKLSIDTELLSYSQLTIEDGDASETDSEFGFGPGAIDQNSTLPGLLGFNLGYVVHPHVIPQLALSFGISKSKSKYDDGVDDGNDDGPKFGSLLFSPRVELPFNPDSRAVLGAVVGFDLRRLRVTETDEDEFGDDYESKYSVLGYGPVLGLASHFFLAAPVSLDVSALFTFDKLSAHAEGDDTEAPDYDTYHQLSFGILIGLSAWPGA
jgi:hypothetical protein